jgi:glucose dehydrogenase
MCRVGTPGLILRLSCVKGRTFYSSSVVVLDAMTGVYKNHLKILRKDWHDWDVSSAPAIIKTAGGKRILSVAPKDGYLYGFDLDTNALLYRQPVTRMENEDAPFAVGKPIHFCPGSTGGAEWNDPAYDPQLNLIFIGEVEWWYHRYAYASRENRRRLARENVVRRSIDQPRSTRGVRQTRFSTGPVGRTPSMPTLAPGDGEQRRIIPFKAA